MDINPDATQKNEPRIAVRGSTNRRKAESPFLMTNFTPNRARSHLGKPALTVSRKHLRLRMSMGCVVIVAFVVVVIVLVATGNPEACAQIISAIVG